ncbi:MAG: D-isomer specific 2-hydroxyacid dehydrogenase, catalytic domain [Acidobacteriota bacterium]|nr:D-isomer specific 2-hydroxyacid dehydrogenase, catalytic domain [Acidobacteriota bacterium]
MKYTVVTTTELPPDARAVLAGELDVIEHPAEQRSEDDLVVILGDADAAIVLASDPVTRAVLEANPNLHMLAVLGDAGNIDLDAARGLGVVIANTPDARLAALDVRLFLRGQEPLHRLV